MPWIDPPELPRHECHLPKATDKDLGRKWGCPTCGTVWQWDIRWVDYYDDSDNPPPGTTVSEAFQGWYIVEEDKRSEYDAFKRVTWEDT